MNLITRFLKRIPSRVWQILFSLLVGILLAVSIMPVIAWYAGLAGLCFLVFKWIEARKTKKINLGLKELANLKHGRAAMYMVIFGILIHASCRIHSQLLINDLHHEALQEKNVIISKMENENK